ITHHYRPRLGNAPRDTIYYGPGGCVCYPGYPSPNISNGTNNTNINDGDSRSLNFPSGTYDPHISEYPNSSTNQARQDDVNVESHPVYSNAPSHNNSNSDRTALPILSNSPGRSYDTNEPHGVASPDDTNSPARPNVPNGFITSNNPGDSNGSPRGLNFPDGNYDPFRPNLSNYLNGQSR
ncbi:hypothetical protein JTE90_017145, partial [Oedothorax gibbosus]